jgi:hypothetical protein
MGKLYVKSMGTTKTVLNPSEKSYAITMIATIMVGENEIFTTNPIVISSKNQVVTNSCTRHTTHFI